MNGYTRFGWVDIDRFWQVIKPTFFRHHTCLFRTRITRIFTDSCQILFQRFSLRFRAVRRSIINSSPKARYSSAFSVEILVKDYNSLRKNVTQIFWSSEDRVKARFHYVESRQNKPKANHGNHGKIFIENVQQI